MASREKHKSRSRRSWYPRHESEKHAGYQITRFYHKEKAPK